METDDSPPQIPHTHPSDMLLRTVERVIVWVLMTARSSTLHILHTTVKRAMGWVLMSPPPHTHPSDMLH